MIRIKLSRLREIEDRTIVLKLILENETKTFMDASMITSSNQNKNLRRS